MNRNKNFLIYIIQNWKVPWKLVKILRSKFLKSIFLVPVKMFEYWSSFVNVKVVDKYKNKDFFSTLQVSHSKRKMPDPEANKMILVKKEVTTTMLITRIWAINDKLDVRAVVAIILQLVQTRATIWSNVMVLFNRIWWLQPTNFYIFKLIRKHESQQTTI